MLRPALLISSGLAVAAVLVGAAVASRQPEWSADELKQIGALSLTSLPPLPADPSNRFADNPDAAELGRALFFDTRLSADGSIACASCHVPDRQFQDDRPLGKGMATGGRRTMPIAGSAYVPFLFWDGRKDSQWSQALGPLENPAEHGADRTMVIRLVTTAYRPQYEALFGPAPSLDQLPAHAMPGGTDDVVAAWNGMSADTRQMVDDAYANVGKAIAAFERTIAPPATRFDAYADAIAAGNNDAARRLLTPAERAGLKIFLGVGNCVTCHNGPLMTDNAFHNIGLPSEDPAKDAGRSKAVAQLKADPFNCLGAFSDARPADCGEFRFVDGASPELLGAFRAPSLRGTGARAPYMHAGQFASLADVIAHYDAAPAAAFGKSELKPLGLTEEERADLEAFLRTLDPIEAATKTASARATTARASP
jgi:cytochrome c peroxidase